jgi:hypothetical protein
MANNQKDNSWILPVGVLALAYFGVLKPITDWLGLTQGKDKQKQKAEIETAEGADGWSPGYYREVMNQNIGKEFCLKRSADLDRLADQIYNAWGPFNDDEQAIFAAIREIKSQVQLSQLVERYSAKYHSDLLTRLKAAWYNWEDGLEPDDFVEIAKMVNDMPVNVKC